MNTSDHYFTIISEECHEIAIEASLVGQRASKILRFGVQEMRPGSGVTNIEHLVTEFNDLYAMFELVQEHGIETPNFLNREQIEAKKAKVKHFLSYSKECGTLDEN